MPNFEFAKYWIKFLELACQIFNLSNMEFLRFGILDFEHARYGSFKIWHARCWIYWELNFEDLKIDLAC